MCALEGGKPGVRVGYAIAAPLTEEVSALTKRLSQSRRLTADAGSVVIGRLGGVELAVCVVGDGPQAALGVERLLEVCDPDALLVVGVGGALSPDLDVADLVVARSVMRGEDERMLPDPRLTAVAIDRRLAQAGTVVTWPRIVGTRDEKEALLARFGTIESPVSIDLESALMASVAAGRGVPYAVVRAVSDTAQESLPLDFNDFLDDSGGIDRARVVAHALRHPLLLPRLMKLKSRMERCSVALADAVQSFVAP